MKILFSCLLAASASFCAAQTPDTAPVSAAPATNNAPNGRIEKGSKVFIEPMDGFEVYLSAAILNKKVPILVVDTREKADYVIAGNSHVEKAGWAKTVFVSPLPHATASITMKDAHNGTLVFAYAVDKSNARKADQSTAEACAKHLKEAIEKK